MNAAVPLLPHSGHGHRAAIGFDPRALRRITAMALRYRWRMLLAVVATALAATSQIVIPQLIGTAVDQVMGLLAGAPSNEAAGRVGLTDTAYLLLGVAVLRGMFTMTQNYLGEAVGHLIASDLRLAYYARLQRLSFSYHDRVHTGELITRGILDIEGVRMWVSTGLLRGVLLCILLFGGAWMLFTVDWPLALLIPRVRDKAGQTCGASATRRIAEGGRTCGPRPSHLDIRSCQDGGGWTLIAAVSVRQALEPCCRVFPGGGQS